MASSVSSLSSTATLSLNNPFRIRTPRINPNSNKKRQMLTKTYARKKDQDHQDHDQADYKYYGNFDGRIVDENMIVLRQRIYEVKMIEDGYEPPEQWMDWEKRLYADNYYGSLICEALLHLQSCLMETRPSLVLGVVAAIALCVPASIAVVFYNLLIHI